jgi:uncharacterized protein YndB with AHSA1/START domain
MTSHFRVSVRSLILLVALVSTTAAGAQEARNTSYTAPEGSRVLQHTIVVPASLREVWDAFTTEDGVRSWAVPVARVDFRLGGIWESSYKLDSQIGDPGNIQNRFLSFLPLRMISMQAIAAPPSFPHQELLPEIFTVIELEEQEEPHGVRVTVSMVGYKSGEGYDVIYRHFERGNPWSLQKLYQRFVDGPVDWQKAIGSVPKTRGER